VRIPGLDLEPLQFGRKLGRFELGETRTAVATTPAQRDDPPPMVSVWRKTEKLADCDRAVTSYVRLLGAPVGVVEDHPTLHHPLED